MLFLKGLSGVRILLYRGKMKLSRLFVKVGLLICIFVYIYSIHFRGVPFTSEFLLGLLGLGMIFYKWFINKSNSIIINGSFAKILLAMLAVICVSILSLACNSTSDIVFIKLMILNSITFAGAYFISLIIRKIYGTVEFATIVKYVTIASCLQMIFSLCLFFIPNSTDIVFKVLNVSELQSNVMDSLEGFRLMGFGTTFFGAGVINSFVLIMIAGVMSSKKKSFWETFGYTFAFVLIGSVGMMMARTTMVGIGLALTLALYNSKFWKLIISKKARDIFKTIFIIISVITIIILNLPPDILELLDVIYNFGFEMFIKFFESGKLETRSTNAMFGMYIFPDNWKTWLIGDGYFADPMDPEFLYYKGVDIGFIRMLFYFGGIGTFVFFLYQFIIIYQTYKKNVNVGAALFVFVYILFVVVNLKGFKDLFPLIILFYFCSQNISKSIYKTKRDMN